MEDIMEGTWQDRPRVVECLYYLQRRAEEVRHDNSTAIHITCVIVFRCLSTEQVQTVTRLVYAIAIVPIPTEPILSTSIQP